MHVYLCPIGDRRHDSSSGIAGLTPNERAKRSFSEKQIQLIYGTRKATLRSDTLYRKLNSSVTLPSAPPDRFRNV